MVVCRANWKAIANAMRLWVGWLGSGKRLRAVGVSSAEKRDTGSGGPQLESKQYFLARQTRRHQQKRDRDALRL